MVYGIGFATSWKSKIPHLQILVPAIKLHVYLWFPLISQLPMFDDLLFIPWKIIKIPITDAFWSWLNMVFDHGSIHPASHHHLRWVHPTPSGIRAARPLRAGDPAAMVLTSAPRPWPQEIFSTSRGSGGFLRMVRRPGPCRKQTEVIWRLWCCFFFVNVHLMLIGFSEN